MTDETYHAMTELEQEAFDTFEVQQYTGREYGWEDVYSADSRRDARERLKEYRENQPEYPARVKTVRRPFPAHQHRYDNFERKGAHVVEWCNCGAIKGE